MTTKISYFIRYIRDGKEVSAWLAIGKKPEEFENVTYVEDRPMVIASEGKSIRLKGTEEILGTCVWMKDHVLEDYEEVDTPEPDALEENKEG